MPALVLKRYEAILQQMINTVVTRSNPPLTDITDSSTFKHMLAAPSREIDEVYYQLGLIPDLFSIDTAVGDDLDARAAEIEPQLISRNAATKATGTVVFGRQGTTGSVVIPAGTVVRTASNIVFSTTEDATIANTQTMSSETSAVAQVAGAAGNVALGTVTQFSSKPAGVDTVTNPGTFVGGSDKESDDAFRQRLKQFVSTLSRGTLYALESAVLGLGISTGQRIVYAHAVDDETNLGEVNLYIDDGSGTADITVPVTGENLTQGFGGPVGGGDSAVGGEVFLFANNKPLKDVTLLNSSTRGTLLVGTDVIVDMALGKFKSVVPLVPGEVITTDYDAYGGLIAAAQKVIDGDDADRLNFPGYRSAGVRVHCQPPQVYQQIVQATVLVAEGYAKADVLALVRQAISAYINGLGISGDVIRSELITRIMEVAGVVNTTVTIPSHDVTLLDDQLPRIAAGNIVLS